MDKIFFRDLRVETIIGIFDWERQVKQTVSLNLEMATDVRAAAATDDIDAALNYKSVAKRIVEFVSESEFLLVETLAERVAGLVIEEFGVPWVRVSVDKPGAIRGASGVGVIIERTRTSPDG